MRSFESITLPFVRVIQPIGDFYVTPIPWDVLREISYADVRRIKDRDLDSFTGIQRELNPARVADLKRYVEQRDATFPTGVIIAIDEACISFDNETRSMTIAPFLGDEENDPIDRGSIAKVLDGQHRIAGLQNYSGKHFDLNVIVFVGADLSDQAGIFSTVNLEQTKVRKSLAFDLLELAKTRSPEKTCHNVAVALDAKAGSPFLRRIKRLGVATPGRTDEKLSQATFVKGLIKCVSEDSISDRDSLMRRKQLRFADARELKRTPFRNAFIRGDDAQIAQCVLNFFLAVQRRWPDAWESSDKNVMISRANGYLGFMRYLKYLLGQWSSEIEGEERFAGALDAITFNDEQFVSSTFLPGAGGEGRLFRSLKAKTLLE